MNNNPQAVSEAKAAILGAVSENVEQLEKEEYKEVLADLIGDLNIMLEAVEQELEEEGGGDHE